MTQQQPPKIEFPCKDYPIKILGDATPEMLEFVLQTTEQFAPEFTRDSINIKPSSKGRYQSVTVLIIATGVEQLEQYHQALRANAAIKMVL